MVFQLQIDRKITRENCKVFYNRKIVIENCKVIYYVQGFISSKTQNLDENVFCKEWSNLANPE